MPLAFLWPLTEPNTPDLQNAVLAPSSVSRGLRDVRIVIESGSHPIC